MKAELELADVDGDTPRAGVLLGDLKEALEMLAAVEAAAFGLAPVLVMDDDVRLAELTARGLRRLGFEAESGSRFRLPRPHEVVVFDLGLAAGLATGERTALKVARPIVVTGATDATSRALAASLDASDYLVKPVDLEVLAVAISRRIAEERR
jgi:DNA-binding response OmpR family regulator